MKNEKGFTIIELLLVFSLMTLISGVGFAALVTYSRSQEVDQDVARFKTTVEKARSMALSSVKPTIDINGDPVSCTTLKSYRVETCRTCASYNYRIIVNCSPNESILEQYKLSNNVSFVSGSIGGCRKLVFTPINSGVQCQNASGVPRTMPQTLQLTGNGKTVDITIDIIGNVTIN